MIPQGELFWLSMRLPLLHPYFRWPDAIISIHVYTLFSTNLSTPSIFKASLYLYLEA